MNHERMSFLDFFAGIGTIRMGFEQAGWVCKGHVEWDKFAQQSYSAIHTPKEDEYCGWDITKVRADELPRADLWAFGAPCQDFSIAGNRQGLKGERSSLVHEIFRLVEETSEENKPTWLFYENVKGMLSSNGGWDFLGILLEMDRLGYDVEWQLLNSKHFGVPQNRERVFTLGHLRGKGGRKVFPIEGQSGQTGGEINSIGTINPERHSDMDILHPDGVSRTLTARDYKGPPMVVSYNRKNGIGEELETAHTLNSTDWRVLNRNQAQNAVVLPCLTPDRIEKMQNGRRFKEDGDPMFTLTAQDRHGVMIKEATKKGYDIAKEGDSINLEHPNPETRRGRVGKGVANTLTTSCNQGVLVDDFIKWPSMNETGYKKAYEGDGLILQRPWSVGSTVMEQCANTIRAGNPKDCGVVQNMRIRRLTPLECWRLQGVPDEYFYRAKNSGVSDSQLYKQAGNACTVNVIFEVARRIRREETA